jgi:hypothetical protein
MQIKNYLIHKKKFQNFHHTFSILNLEKKIKTNRLKSLTISFFDILF